MKKDSPFTAGLSRRDALVGGLVATAAAGLPLGVLAQTDQQQSQRSSAEVINPDLLAFIRG